MDVREINENEVTNLFMCVSQLSEYHNQVSENFKGFYPSKPYEETLENFCANLRKHLSHIAVIEDSSNIAGFCKVDIDILHRTGKLDYLIVLEEYRGRGYGVKLMDWAMDTFHKNNINHIEVKVIAGNEAIHLYEKYGFKVNAHILWHCEK